MAIKRYAFATILGLLSFPTHALARAGGQAPIPWITITTASSIALAVVFLAVFLTDPKRGSSLLAACFLLSVAAFTLIDVSSAYLDRPIPLLAGYALRWGAAFGLLLAGATPGFPRLIPLTGMVLSAANAVLASASMVIPVKTGFFWAAWTGSALLGLYGLATAFLLILLQRGALGRFRLVSGAFAGFSLGAAILLAAVSPFEEAVSLPASVSGVVRIVDAVLAGLFALIAAYRAILEIVKPVGEKETLDDQIKTVSDSINRFIPTPFLEYLEKNGVSDLELGDHIKREMTIYFSDIRAFTELSERLTLEENFAFINSYLARMVPIIEKNEGFVDKYIGDAIMALYPSPSGADGAVRTAIETQVQMREYNTHRAKVGYVPLTMGIGVNTGPLMLGIVGVRNRMESTVISDAVNLASRLQAIAKAFNIGLVISEQSFKSLADPGQYLYRFIGKVKVKGKDAPVSVFEILNGLPESTFERKMRANRFFEQGMLAYYQKEYSDGVFYLKRSLEETPEDGAARFYLESCLRKTMPPR